MAGGYFLCVLFWSALNIPITIWFRLYGIKHLHFLEHDDDLCPGHSEEIGYSEILQQFVDDLQNAEISERTVLRATVKKWLATNWANLSESEIAFAKEQFGYLLPSNW